MKISVIIPTYNEADHIGQLIHYLNHCPDNDRLEIIIADGASNDSTAEKALEVGVKVIVSPQKGRAVQMNAGAKAASGDLFYFLHADSYPPSSFVEDILKATRRGYASGCYRLTFDHSHWFLTLNSWFTRFDINALRFGDQSLFVERDSFFKAGRFREDLIVMEDQEIILRIRKYARFIILPKAVTTSARKYLVNGIFKTQAVFFLIYFMYQLGFSQPKLVNTYRSFFLQDKV